MQFGSVKLQKYVIGKNNFKISFKQRRIIWIYIIIDYIKKIVKNYFVNSKWIFFFFGRENGVLLRIIHHKKVKNISKIVLIGMQILFVTATHKSHSFGSTGLIGKEWYKACQELCDT